MILQTLGHYRFTAKRGEGGTGAVYRATDSKLGRAVLPRAVARDAQRMGGFDRVAPVPHVISNWPALLGIIPGGASQ